MEPKLEGPISERMELAFDLCEAGDQIMRENLRRRHPEASDTEIEELFRRWLLQRPGAEHGDAGGPGLRPRKLPS